MLSSVENIRQRVLELLTKYDKESREEILIWGYIHEFNKHYPTEIINIICLYDGTNKAESTNILMKKWKSKENDLLKTLCMKYHEKYEKIKPLQIKKEYGIGTKIICTGNVRKCKKRSDERRYALKVVNKKNMDGEKLEVVERAINIWRELDHPNIVKMYDIFDSSTKICIIMDFVAGTELFDRIIIDGRFQEKNAIITFKTFMLSLQYLHDQKLVHANIQSEHILFTEKIGYEVKLAAFNKIRSCKDGPLKTSCISHNYAIYDATSCYHRCVSPELLRGERFDTQTDIWSAGVILYTILCGFPPFEPTIYEDEDKVLTKIITCDYDMPRPYWDNVSDNAKDLVKKLLVVDPNKRLTANQALQHPWLN